MVTYEELVEKVARDLAADMVNLGIQPDSLIADSEGMMAPLWMSFVAPAKAAIATIHEALKEPSGEQVDAFQNEYDKVARESGWVDRGTVPDGGSVKCLLRAALSASPLVEEERE